MQKTLSDLLIDTYRGIRRPLNRLSSGNTLAIRKYPALFTPLSLNGPDVGQRRARNPAIRAASGSARSPPTRPAARPLVYLALFTRESVHVPRRRRPDSRGEGGKA